MNLLKGQKIQWTEPVFEGKFPKSKFVGSRTNIGTITKDSYGLKRGQHSFTIEIIASDGANPFEPKHICRRLGRNLYKSSIILEEPINKESIEKDKFNRAQAARYRKYLNWISEAEFEGKFHKLDKIPASDMCHLKSEIISDFPIVALKLNLTEV
jgi:hypothetical protein